MFSLAFYLKSAHKAICKWGNSNMLSDEDAISEVAHFMMVADDRFDGRGSRDGFRMSYAKYGVLHAISKYKRNKKKHRNVQSLDVSIGKKNNSGRDVFLHECIEDKSARKSREEQDINSNLETIINGSNLTSKQKISIIRYYIYGDTYKEIGDRNGTSYEAVRQSINAGLKKLKNGEIFDYFAF